LTPFAAKKERRYTFTWSAACTPTDRDWILPAE